MMQDKYKQRTRTLEEEKCILSGRKGLMEELYKLKIDR